MGPLMLVIQPAPVTKLIVKDVLEAAISPQHHGGRPDAPTPLRIRDAG
jgi:hypothetical protein